MGARADRSSGTRRLGLACAVGVAMLAAPARGQEPDRDAALHASDGASEVDAARSRFLEAVELLDRGRHHEACARLEEVRRTVDAPSVRWNLAFCRRSLGQYQAARGHLLAFVAAARSDAHRAVARRVLAELRAQSAVLRLVFAGAVDGRLEVRVDGVAWPADASGAARTLDPGPVVIEVQAGDRVIRRWRVRLSPGETRTIHLGPPPSAGR